MSDPKILHKLSNGVLILDTSHRDHDVSIEALEAWALGAPPLVIEPQKTHIHTVTLEGHTGLCGLHGPCMHDDPVPASEVTWGPRHGRATNSRLCKRPPRPTGLLTVICGPHQGEPLVLYTAFWGPLAPRELGDPTITSDGGLQESFDFWVKKGHALTDPVITLAF
jgi:hypothetical protein